MAHIIDPQADEKRIAAMKREGLIVSEDGKTVRVGINYMMQHPQEFGYALIVPDWRKDGPQMPFTVEKTDMKPDSEFAQFWRRRSKTEAGPGEIVQGDLLLHVETGMFLHVVERISQWNFRAGCLVPPQTPETMERFLSESRDGHGTGQYVLCGSCFTKLDWENALKQLDMKEPEVVSTEEDIKQARGDTFKHPDRKSWSEQGKKVVKDIHEIRKNPRDMKAMLQAMVGQGTIGDWDKLADKYARMRGTTKGGLEVSVFNTAAIMEELKAKMRAGARPDEL